MNCKEWRPWVNSRYIIIIIIIIKHSDLIIVCLILDEL